MHDFVAISDSISAALGRNNDLDDSLTITGEVIVELWDENGVLKHFERTHNLVVTTGKQHIADQLSSTPGQAAMSHMAIGSGATAPAAGDTTLVTELDRNALTSRTDSGAVVTYVGNWAAGDGTSADIEEAGIFNAASAGTMLARAVFTQINKGASDTLQITWNVTIG